MSEVLTAEQAVEVMHGMFAGRNFTLERAPDRSAPTPWFSIAVGGKRMTTRWCPSQFESLAIHGVETQKQYLDALYGRIQFELSQELTLDICEHGHRFASLANHPIRDGHPRCPHCMSIGLDNLYAEQVLAGSEFIDVDPLLVRLREHLNDPAFDAGERGYTQSLIDRIKAKRQVDAQRERFKF